MNLVNIATAPIRGLIKGTAFTVKGVGKVSQGSFEGTVGGIAGAGRLGFKGLSRVSETTGGSIAVLTVVGAIALPFLFIGSRKSGHGFDPKEHPPIMPDMAAANPPIDQAQWQEYLKAQEEAAAAGQQQTAPGL